jgi:hypothetical protein
MSQIWLKLPYFSFNHNRKQCNGCSTGGLCSKVLGNCPAAASLQPWAGYGAPCYRAGIEQFISCIYKSRAMYSLHSICSMVMKTYPRFWICSHMYTSTQSHVYIVMLKAPRLCVGSKFIY